MPPLIKAAALTAATLTLSDGSSAAACRHYSIWNFPSPQPCPAKQVGQFINEDPPAPTPAPSPALPPTQDQQAQRQQAIEKLKKQLNSQKQQ
jgi:hypothetical protein